MSRKEFIESHGATCKNHQWSWSFINEYKKFIIFGAWDRDTEDNGTKIFSEEWMYNNKGRKNSGYDQSRGHIRLIEEEGYDLFTFPMVFSDAKQDESGAGPAKVDDFEPILQKRGLLREGNSWYAVDYNTYS